MKNDKVCQYSRRWISEARTISFYSITEAAASALSCQSLWAVARAQRGAGKTQVLEYSSTGRTAACSTASSPHECFSLLDLSHHPINTLLRLRDMIQKTPAALWLRNLLSNSERKRSFATFNPSNPLNNLIIHEITF